MPVHSLLVYGLPGNVSVQDNRIIGAQILQVVRSGTNYEDSATAALALRPYYFDATAGRITFDNEFTGPTVGRINRLLLEPVFILYKTPI